MRRRVVAWVAAVSTLAGGLGWAVGWNLPSDNPVAADVVPSLLDPTAAVRSDPAPTRATPSSGAAAASVRINGTRVAGQPRRSSPSTSPARETSRVAPQGLSTLATAQHPTTGTPIRAAFYYPWFPEAWKQQARYPFTSFHPDLYDGSDAAVIDRQIADMTYAGIQAGIASWWGIGSRTDQRIPLLLQRARPTGFRWSLYYEREGTTDPSPTQISADLAHIRSRFAGSPAFLTVSGAAVIFVYAGDDGCDMARRWSEADTHGFHIVLKVFQGYRACAYQPDSWHQYAPAKRLDVQQHESAAVSPGFWLVGSTERLARDTEQFRAAATIVATSATRWQLVTTFNEWGEGTAVESAQEWASPTGRGRYLDILREVFSEHPVGGR